MKIRIGFGVAAAGLGPVELVGVGRAIVESGLDSLWLSEVLSLPGLDPVVGLAWVGAAQPGLKLGTTMLLPGRNLVRLARQAAALDVLSGGRFLCTFVPGIPRGPERSAVGPPPAERGAVMDDALPVLRRLWAGQTVTHQGPAGTFDAVAIAPLPVQDPFDVWLGGTAPAALERCGRLADGWLPSLCSPAEVAEGRAVIEAAAERAGRSLSPEHFGVSIGYSAGPLDPRAVASLAERAKGRPIEQLVPAGDGALQQLLEEFVAVGFSKFVLRPVRPPRDWALEAARLAGVVGGLQT